jgi:hypothetical protein
MKKCSTSAKHDTHNRMATVSHPTPTENNKYCKDTKSLEPLCAACGNLKCTAAMENSFFLTKLNLWPTNSTSGHKTPKLKVSSVYPQKLKETNNPKVQQQTNALVKCGIQ